MNARTQAKLLFHAAGWLSHIKTWQRCYEFTGTLRIPYYIGRRWLPCTASVRLLDRSMQLDWDHWDHWAGHCDQDCKTSPCRDCGGQTCPHSEGDDVETAQPSYTGVASPAREPHEATPQPRAHNQPATRDRD